MPARAFSLGAVAEKVGRGHDALASTGGQAGAGVCQCEGTEMATARVERRLAAILAADVVGYSRLMERDEAGTFARLKALRSELIGPALERHGGRFVDLKGDGAIVEFQSAVAAVKAAAEIQRAMLVQDAGLPEGERIRYRIGINLGEVIADDGTIYGDGVNVAARIEALCEPGGVWLSRSVYSQVRGKLDLTFAPTGLHQVKNISEAVETFRVALDGVAPVAPRPAARVARWLPVAAAALVAVVLAAGVWRFWPSGAAPPNARPGVAVLPFANLGGDEATGRLADGITEDVITDLARFGDLDVIARNSTEAYKGKPVDVRQIGKDLSVNHVLEGSIQRQGDRIRVTAQLIDARTGAHVWTDRWDRPAADVFAVQNEVVERTANSLEGVLSSEALAAARRKHPTDLAAYDLALLGSMFARSQAEVEKGLAYCDAAIGKDPDFASAYICKAWRLWQLAQYKGHYNDTYAEMERLARKAIELEPYRAYAHLTLGFAAGSLGRNAEGLAATERAVELAPSYAEILIQAANSMPFFGKPERGVELCERALRLNPAAPAWYYMNCITSDFLVGRYRAAVEASDHAAPLSELNPQLLVWRAASLAELGREEDAAATLEMLRRRYPEVSFEYLINNGWTFERQRDQDQILASARKAGVRVCATAAELSAYAQPRRLPECLTG